MCHNFEKCVGDTASLLLDFLAAGAVSIDDVLRGARAQASIRNGLEKLLNFRRAIDERLSPESVSWVSDQLDEGDQKTPRMRSVNDQTL